MAARTKFFRVIVRQIINHSDQSQESLPEFHSYLFPCRGARIVEGSLKIIEHGDYYKTSSEVASENGTLPNTGNWDAVFKTNKTNKRKVERQHITRQVETFELFIFFKVTNLNWSFLLENRNENRIRQNYILVLNFELVSSLIVPVMKVMQHWPFLKVTVPFEMQKIIKFYFLIENACP